MSKPYFDPKTKETYLKANYNGITFRFILGSVSIEKGDDPLHSYKVERNEFGDVVAKVKFYSHYVCLGTDRCFTCGKVLTND